MVFSLALALLLGVAADDGARFVQDRFVISFWVDPPAGEDMDERYREIAEAGFTVALGGFGAREPEAIRRQLELCEKYGLKAIVARAGLAPEKLPEAPSCWGYMTADEPGAGAFAELRQVVDATRAARPGKLSYINLFPNYASPGALGTKDYDEHVARFVDEVRPDVLSMDHYPMFLPNADGRPAYCANLEVMRRHSLRAKIPFWNFFNTMPFGPHSDPTEAQLRWQIYTSLAYGAKGVLYFCYWTPRGGEFPKGGAIITAEGRRTRHYDEAKRINAALKNLGPTLMRLTSAGVVRVAPDAELKKALKATPLKSLTPGDYLIGVLRHEDGRRAVLLNNYSFAYSAWPTVTFEAAAGEVKEMDPATGREVPLQDDSPAMEGVQLSLDAGQGRLFVLP